MLIGLTEEKIQPHTVQFCHLMLHMYGVKSGDLKEI